MTNGKTSKRIGISMILVLVVLLLLYHLSKRTAALEVLIDWQAVPTYAGFYVAEEKGLYRGQGLEVKIVEGNGALTAAKLISEGKYKVGSCSAFYTAIGIAQGMNIVTVAVIYPRIPTVIYSLEGKRNKPIRSPADLPNMRIGINADSINAKEFEAFLRKQGLNTAEIKTPGVGWDADPLLIAGEVDGLLNYAELNPVALRVKGHRVHTIRLGEGNKSVDSYSLNLIANRNFLNEHRDVVEKFVRATLEGYKSLSQNPIEAADIFCKATRRCVKEEDRQYVRESIMVVKEEIITKGKDADEIGRMDEEGWKRTVDTLFQVGLLPTNVNPKQLYDPRFAKGLSE